MKKSNTTYVKLLFTIMILFPFFINAADEKKIGGLNVSMQEQIAQSGFADIIITINNMDGISSLKLNDIDDVSRMKIVNSMQSSLINGLDNRGYRIHQQYQYTPQIHMEVNEKVLKQLEADSRVIVSMNMLEKATLAESVPRIFTRQGNVPYDGDNKWAVAVLDTGVDKTHPFLKNKIISEACYSGGLNHSAVTSVCPGGVKSSTSVGSGINCPASLNGCSHGTHVAGIAAGSNTSFQGVAKKAKIISIQVFSKITDYGVCGSSYTCLRTLTSDLIKGLERVYALRNRYSIASVNMSLGGGSYASSCNSDPRRPIIRLLKNAKIATIVASGNDGYNGYIGAPACISEAIAVGSTLDTSDVRSYFSNSSVMLDLYAPGSSITSSVPGGGYSIFNGTSMATPHVAGAWALARDADESASVDKIESLFKGSGVGITVNGVTRKRISLYPVLDSLGDLNPIADILPAILNLILDDTPPPPPPPPVICQYTMSLGATKQGSWKSTCVSAHRGNAYAKYYIFTLNTARTVTIDLHSTKDTYMYLLSGSGENGSLLEEDDDDGPGLDSKIVKNLPVGTYTIEATTYDDQQVGNFTLTIQ